MAGVLEVVLDIVRSFGCLVIAASWLLLRLDLDVVGRIAAVACHSFYAASLVSSLSTVFVDVVYTLVLSYGIVCEAVGWQWYPTGLPAYLRAWVAVWAMAMPACFWLWSLEVPVLVAEGSYWLARAYAALLARILGRPQVDELPSTRWRALYNFLEEGCPTQEHAIFGGRAESRRLRSKRLAASALVALRAAAFAADAGRRGAAWRLEHARALLLGALCVLLGAGRDLSSCLGRGRSTWVVRHGAVHAAAPEPHGCDNCGICLDELCAAAADVAAARAVARRAPGLSLARLRAPRRCGGVAAARADGHGLLAWLARSPCGHVFHAACAVSLVGHQRWCPLCRERWQQGPPPADDSLVMGEEPVARVMPIGFAIGLPLNLLLLSSRVSLSLRALAGVFLFSVLL